MGADATLLKAAYQTHVVYQRPAFESPEVDETKEQQTSKGVINETNWKEHLGNEKFVLGELNTLHSFQLIFH